MALALEVVQDLITKVLVMRLCNCDFAGQEAWLQRAQEEGEDGEGKKKEMDPRVVEYTRRKGKRTWQRRMELAVFDMKSVFCLVKYAFITVPMVRWAVEDIAKEEDCVTCDNSVTNSGF